MPSTLERSSFTSQFDPIEDRHMGQRILVVDDDRLCRLATQAILERLGFEVDVLGDGRGAVDAEAKGDLDAIVMDCQMPHMDGFQATAAIRRHQADHHGAHTPIIGLSSRTMEGDDQAALAQGMDVYITKPVSVKKMRAALEQVGVTSNAMGRPTAQ